MQKDYDVLIVGGGIVGITAGLGLARQGVKVAVLDDIPEVDRASRSNMGLIWCQSKCLNIPNYDTFGFLSANKYPEYVKEIEELSGINVGYRASGGIIPCLGDDDYQRRADNINNISEAFSKTYTGKEAEYPVEMLDRKGLEKVLPHVNFGKNVVGGAYSSKDAWVNPLKLLFASRIAFKNAGGDFFYPCCATNIRCKSEGYLIDTNIGKFACGKIVLAGGLSNRGLCKFFEGFEVPIIPNKAQVILLERIPDILPTYLLGIARLPGGTVMIGYSHEYVATDSSIEPYYLANTAKWAFDIWPDLAKLRIIRCWSAMRVWPKDGLPIYDNIPGHKNAFIVSSHSAVTLAGINRYMLPNFIMGKGLMKEALPFNLARFNKN